MKLDKRIIFRIANEFLSIFLVLGILVAVYMVTQTALNLQFDLTHTSRFSLSDVTLKLLDRLNKQNQEVSITLFYKDYPSPEERLRRGRVYDLLLEYHRRSGKKIALPRVVSPDQRPDEVKRLGVRISGTIALEMKEAGNSDPSKSRTTLITPSMFWATPFENGRPGKEQFHGENAMSSALLKMIEGKRRTVYFVQGHEEAFPHNTDPKGLSEWTAKLELQNLEVRSLQLFQAGNVPENASLVVIAGPRNTYLPNERDVLLEYTKRGGKILILTEFNTNPGLDTLFNFLGVEVGNDLIIDTRSYQGNLIAPLPLFGNHPIVADLHAANETVLLSTVRSIERALGDTRGISTTHLLLSSQQAWAEKDFLHAKETRFDEKSGDRKGPISMAIAVTRPATEESKVLSPETRAVVFGDADFATNELVVFGSNIDLLLNSVHWLIGSEENIGISPKNPDIQIMTMSFHQIWSVFVIVIVIVPGIVLGFGIVRWWNRRSL